VLIIVTSVTTLYSISLKPNLNIFRRACQIMQPSMFF